MTRRFVPFNFNNQVRVKLTDYGRRCAMARNAELHEASGGRIWPSMPEEDADGWSTWQAWDLMQRFGDALNHIGELPFSMAVEIEIDE